MQRVKCIRYITNAVKFAQCQLQPRKPQTKDLMMTYDLTHIFFFSFKNPLFWKRGIVLFFGLVVVCSCRSLALLRHVSTSESLPWPLFRHTDMLVRLLKTESSNRCRTQKYDNYCSSLFNKNNWSLDLFLKVCWKSVFESLHSCIHYLCNADFYSYCPFSMTWCVLWHIYDFLYSFITHSFPSVFIFHFSFPVFCHYLLSLFLDGP